MLTFQFINKSYRPFLSKKKSCFKIVYRAGSDPDPGSGSDFFQRLDPDPDPHKNGLDP
jgi:hypothetical protein